MPKALTNKIEVEYETFGDASNPAILLVMGLGAQMIRWPEKFCMLLVDHGFFVIRFDNRDVGLSTHFHEFGLPDMAAIKLARSQGVQMKAAPYLVTDMADDAAGLLDALNIKRAHVVGASLGGYIVQEMAINHASKLISMTSIMSSTQRRSLPTATPEATAAVMSRPNGKDEAAILEHAFKTSTVIAGPIYPPSKEDVDKITKASMARNIDALGVARQMAAIAATNDRVNALVNINIPTLVIHGTEDPLVPVECGEDTAACIPNARLELIEGMGHALPLPLIPDLVKIIVQHAQRTLA